MINKKTIKLLILLFFSLPSLCNVFAQETKFLKRVMTESEFQKLKSLTGTYEEGKNYNKIINGYGTGLMPPTEEQWTDMRNQPLLIDRIETTFEIAETPSNHDNSATNWFPPIGNQGGQGSCVSWACGYYVKTFQEAKEHNWDIWDFWDNRDKIFSPAFIYHQVNYGVDNGSSFTNNMNLLGQIGCCTYDKMPYNTDDYTSWPSEDAWRQAPWYRSKTGYGYMMVDTDIGVEDLKQLLVSGNLAIISVNADFYGSALGPEDLWRLDNYNTSSTNHANTIVGYDDNFGPYYESGNENTYGAFKVANSWGIGQWENVDDGYYYISYECLK